MIYETPTFSPGGDRYMLIEFGDEMNLDLNFLGQGLEEALDGGTIPGVIETAPCFATTLIHYEPEIIAYVDLKQEVSRLIDSLGPSEDIEMDSRLFYFQTLYLDPWSKECINDYREKIWDHAAGSVIVECAGGRVSDAEGRDLDFRHGRSLEENRGIVATCGSIHQEVLDAVRAARR